MYLLNRRILLNILEMKPKKICLNVACCICTLSRWETIANFIKQHLAESNRTAKETLAKAKDLQKMGIYIFNLSRGEMPHQWANCILFPAVHANL